MLQDRNFGLFAFRLFFLSTGAKQVSYLPVLLHLITNKISYSRLIQNLVAVRLDVCAIRVERISPHRLLSVFKRGQYHADHPDALPVL
jgi:hypothetical protein